MTPSTYPADRSINRNFIDTYSVFVARIDMFITQKAFYMADFDPNLPFNDLPLLPPPTELIETTAILKKCIDARVALAELKQAAELIPNAAVLVNALPLLEARARIAQLFGSTAKNGQSDEDWKHQLRDAQRLYTEIGAAGHAERLASELDT